jgi:hypothetical protein
LLLGEHRCRLRRHAFGTFVARLPAPICRVGQTWSGPRSEWHVTVAFQQDVWGCPSFCVTSPISSQTGIYNADDPPPARMNIDVVNVDSLSVSPTMSVKSLEHFVLESDKPVCIAAINRNVFLPQMSLA